MDPRPFIRLMRPTDWVKNLVVLVALVTSKKLLDASAATHALIAFVAFCLVSSGFYAINDALDVERDREHPLKRLRPVAAGRITPRAATAFGAVLILLSVVLAFVVNRATVAVLLAYVVLQLAYNVKLKHTRMLDVTTLALGFVLRAVAGAAAVGVPTSIWLVLCVFFLCLYLGFIKRLADLASAERSEGEGTASPKWHSPAGYDSRSELQWLLALSAAMAMTTYLMYALSPHAESLFGPRAMGFALLSPLVIVTIYRFYLRATVGLSDRPLDALVEDRVIQWSVVLYGIGTVASLYAPYVDQFFQRLLIR